MLPLLQVEMAVVGCSSSRGCNNVCAWESGVAAAAATSYQQPALLHWLLIILLDRTAETAAVMRDAPIDVAGAAGRVSRSIPYAGRTWFAPCEFPLERHLPFPHSK